MCFFRKIKINGVSYSIPAGEQVAQKLVEKLHTLQKQVDELDAENKELVAKNHKLSCANGELKKQLRDLPARSKSGRYVKREKKPVNAADVAQTTTENVEPEQNAL